MTSSKNPLQLLNLLFLAMVAGVFTLTLILMYLVEMTEYQPGGNDLTQIFNILVPAGVLVALGGSYFLFKNAMASVRPEMELEEKLSIYRQGAILRFAVLEGPALFASVSYFLVGQQMYLAVTAALLAMMVYFRPTKDRLVTELGLSEREAREL